MCPVLTWRSSEEKIKQLKRDYTHFESRFSCHCFVIVTLYWLFYRFVRCNDRKHVSCAFPIPLFFLTVFSSFYHKQICFSFCFLHYYWLTKKNERREKKVRGGNLNEAKRAWTCSECQSNASVLYLFCSLSLSWEGTHLDIYQSLANEWSSASASLFSVLLSRFFFEGKICCNVWGCYRSIIRRRMIYLSFIFWLECTDDHRRIISMFFFLFVQFIAWFMFTMIWSLSRQAELEWALAFQQ